MKKFYEIFKKTPPLPKDEQILRLCREHPSDVPISVLIGQYKGAKDENDKKLLYQILAEIVTDDVMHELEVY